MYPGFTLVLQKKNELAVDQKKKYCNYWKLFKKIKLRFRFDVKQKQIMERKIFTLHFSPVDKNEPAVDQKDYVYQPISLL